MINEAARAGDTATGPLWGRDDEMGDVARLVSGTDGTAGGVLIAGEPGIGKSSLWSRGVAVAVRSGRRVLATTCVEAEAGMPYAASEALFADLLAEYSGALPAPQRAALEAAFLCTRADAAADSRTVAVGMMTLLRRALEDGPVVLAVDDLQWLDAESRACLVYAVRRAAGDRLTLLLATREPSAWWRPARDRSVDALVMIAEVGGRVLRLGPLSDTAIARMLRDRLGVVLSSEERRRLAADTGGNPFWALELGSQRHGDLHPARLRTPAALGALVVDRIADLDDDVVDVAALVAALGRPRVTTVLPTITADDPRQAERVLDLAVDAGLLVVTDGRLAPAHPLIGSALLATLPPFRRRRLHRRAARLADSVEGCAHHLLQATTASAGEPDGLTDAFGDGDAGDERAELLVALDAAAVAADRRGAPATAARFGARALVLVRADAPAVAARRVAVAELHYRAGEPDEALAALEAVDLAGLDPDLLDRAAPLLAQTTNDQHGGSAARAVVTALEGLCPPDGLRHQALIATLRADLRCGADGERREVAQRAVELAEVAGSPVPLRRRALGALAAARLDAGDPFGDLLGRLDALDRLDGPSGEGGAPHVNGVDVELLHGMSRWHALDLAGAREAFAAILERLLATGDTAAIALAGAVLAHADIVAGDPDAAEKTLRRLEDHVDRDSQEWPYVFLHRGRLHLIRGEHEALDELLEQQDAIGRRSPRVQRFTERLRGHLAMQRGDHERAVVHLERYAEQAARHGVHDLYRRIVAEVDLADALIGVNRGDEAEKVADRLSVRGAGHALAHGHERRIRAGIAARRDRDLDRALVLAHEAVVLLEQCPFPADHGQSLVTLAEVHELRGERKAAAEHRRRAHALFVRIGYRWWAERAAEPTPAVRANDLLSPSERAVADLVAGGASNREAAGALHLSVRTVENHLARIYRRLGIRSRRDLTLRWSSSPPVPCHGR